MSINKQNIMLLCKVVDNFGDIGVVYRLAKALADARPSLKLTLVVSNLESFSAMAPGIRPEKKIQNFRYKNLTWEILSWNLDTDISEEKAAAIKAADGNQIILECFQCGRPDWLENILFCDDFTKTVQIVNIDYLTAEGYADDFHLLRSGTRKTCIKKINFMPGFTGKSGGLIFSENLAPQHLSMKKTQEEADFKISFFAYEKNCMPVISAISHFQEEKRKTQEDFSVLVYVAAGKSRSPFINAWEKCGKPFKITELPFLPQEDWDYLLTQMDFNFVRGEDSLSRAALSGLPYVWNAYIQDDDYQLVKVDALLERMRPFFDNNDFELLKNVWDSYNLESKEINKSWRELSDLLLRTCSSGKMKSSFKNYSLSIKKNGNLAQHLLDYLDGLDC